MDTLKPFDPNDIDETLTRLVAFGDAAHLLFPYIDARGAAPKFDSIGQPIKGPSATVENFAALSAAVGRAAEGAHWFISFNTPWLLDGRDAEAVRQRTSGRTSKRA